MDFGGRTLEANGHKNDATKLLYPAAAPRLYFCLGVIKHHLVAINPFAVLIFLQGAFLQHSWLCMRHSQRTRQHAEKLPYTRPRRVPHLRFVPRSDLTASRGVDRRPVSFAGFALPNVGGWVGSKLVSV